MPSHSEIATDALALEANATKRASASQRAAVSRDDRNATLGRDLDEPWLSEEESRDPSNRDPVTGRLLPGHSIPGPGRPRGSLDFMAICRTKARETGLKLSDLVWAATRGLAVRAARGDAAAAKVLLDRLCGPVDKALVEVDARSIGLAAGPPIPQGGEFSDWVLKLNEVAASQGLLGATTPGELAERAASSVEAAVAEVELLS